MKRKHNKNKTPKNRDVSQSQKDIIDSILNGDSSTSSSKLTKEVNRKLTTELDEDFIISGLMGEALEGNVKALELLGEKFGLFDKHRKDNLIDVFANEGTLESNILRFLDILEDKYSDISITPIIAGDLEVDNRGRKEDTQEVIEQKIKEEILEEEIIKFNNEVELPTDDTATDDDIVETSDIPISLSPDTFATTDPINPDYKPSSFEDDDDGPLEEIDSLFIK